MTMSLLGIADCRLFARASSPTFYNPHFADSRQTLNLPSLSDSMLKNNGAVNPDNTTWSPLRRALRPSYTAFVAFLPSSS